VEASLSAPRSGKFSASGRAETLADHRADRKEWLIRTGALRWAAPVLISRPGSSASQPWRRSHSRTWPWRTRAHGTATGGHLTVHGHLVRWGRDAEQGPSPGRKVNGACDGKQPTPTQQRIRPPGPSATCQGRSPGSYLSECAAAASAGGEPSARSPVQTLAQEPGAGIAWEAPEPSPPILVHYELVKLLSPDVWGSAAVKCSNQAAPHLTFTDPIWPSDLPQRPSLTFLPLATDQKVRVFPASKLAADPRSSGYRR
jgi:hypothetical protein